jgi:hypothetical protein
MRSRKWTVGLSLVLAFVFGSLVISQVSGQVDEGLIAYFKFDKEDKKTLTDSSGLGNDATISGDVEWVEGKYNKGLQFDGELSYADVPGGTFGPFEAVTITAWIKLEQMPTTHSYNIAGMTTGPGQGFYVELYSVNLAAWQCGPDMNASTPYVATFGEWHHVAGVYTGEQILLYIDGEEKAQGAGTTLPGVAALPFRISGDHSETANWGGSIDGVIDEVRLYDRALTPDEIKDTMEESGDGAAVAPADMLPTTWAKIKGKY